MSADIPVGLVTSLACERHATGAGHPERPQRLAAVLDRLTRDGVRSELAEVSAPAADDGAITTVHSAAYVARVADAIESGARWIDSPDVAVSSASLEAARRAAGGALHAADRVAAGEWRAAFCALRPPGHHAEESLAMGFCLFNNAALVARRLRDHHGLARVAVVDWDVHHGNGTQHLFEDDPSVFYASLHQFPHYPGTGAASERGTGAGEGATLNLPQAAETGDSEWLAAFEDVLLPALDAFRPEALVISAGFDAHALDPLSGTRLTADAFARMTRGVRDIAARHGAGRVVSLLEGGYSLEGLAASASAHVAALLE